MNSKATVLLPLLFVIGSAQAHEAWVQPGPGQTYPIEYGDFTSEAYPTAKVRTLEAYDARGRAVKAKVVATPYGAIARVRGQPSILTLFFDNGYWAKRADGGYINARRSELPPGVAVSHPLKYGKTILRWDTTASRAVGQRIEIVPINDQPPKPDSPMTVQVLFEGQPLGDTEVELVGVTPEGKSPHTDANGMITVTLGHGIQRLASEHKLTGSQEPGIEQTSVTAALVFVVP